MPDRNTVVRALHDLGLAAWFGGSLMGVIGLNGAAEDEGGNLRTAQIASNGWAKWTPFNVAAIGMHLLGGAGVLLANRRRVVGQRGVGASTTTKVVLTVAALGATGYSRVLGKKIELAASSDPVDAEKADAVPIGIDQAQQQLRVVQWTIPLLTGALEVVNALHGEQQRPEEQARGVAQRAAGLSARLLGVAA